jgi:hypothetical protein
MKLRSLLLTAACAVAVTAGFTSCSSDDDDWDPMKEGSKIKMVETRAFVLNEGAQSHNNAGITYFDWKQDTTFTKDFFYTQNGRNLGDVGQDIIVGEDDYLYVVVSGSSYIAKLNSVGVEKARVAFDEKIGEPRYAVEKDGYLYVTSYGGYVVKVKTSDMKIAGSVVVGANPEYIIEKDGFVYCTCSGWGKDKRVAYIDTKNFSKANFYEVMDNPDRIIKANNRVFVQGYGAAYDYPWGELNLSTGKFTPIGNASSWTEYDDVIYLVNSVTDWSTYTTTNYFFTYNAKTSKLSEWKLSGAPAALASTSVYGMSTNKKTGDIYIMTTDFVNNGKVYHVKKDGTFVKSFDSTGVNPRKIVFLD